MNLQHFLQGFGEDNLEWVHIGCNPTSLGQLQRKLAKILRDLGWDCGCR